MKTERQISLAAAEFAERWKGRGYERGESQPFCSLADLYDELTMPVELRKAHQANDRAVMQAYGFPVKSTFTESQCVAELFKLYKEITK